MRIEQSVGSYPTPRRTVIADISPRSDYLKTFLVRSSSVDTAVDTDRFRSHRSFRTFELIVVKCPWNAVSIVRYFLLHL